MSTIPSSTKSTPPIPSSTKIVELGERFIIFGRDLEESASLDGISSGCSSSCSSMRLNPFAPARLCAFAPKSCMRFFGGPFPSRESAGTR